MIGVTFPPNASLSLLLLLLLLLCVCVKDCQQSWREKFRPCITVGIHRTLHAEVRRHKIKSNQLTLNFVSVARLGPKTQTLPSNVTHSEHTNYTAAPVEQLTGRLCPARAGSVNIERSTNRRPVQRPRPQSSPVWLRRQRIARALAVTLETESVLGKKL